MVPRNEQWWSSMRIGLSEGEQAGGDEVIKVYKPGGTVPDAPRSLLRDYRDERIMGQGLSGWYYKTRKTTRPECCQRGTMITVKSWGRAVRGKGTVTATAECQSELTCVEAVCQ